MFKRYLLLIISIVLFAVTHGQQRNGYYFRSQKNEIKSGTKTGELTFSFPVFSIPPVFEEQFDDNSIPGDWQSTESGENTGWRIMKQPQKPFSTIYPASNNSILCPWSEEEKDEWMISPDITIPHGETFIRLYFFAGFSKPWLKNGANLHFYSIINNDTIALWNATQYLQGKDSWNWRFIEILMNDSIAGKKVKLAWQYQGKNGDLVALDHVVLYSGNKSMETDIDSFNFATQIEEPVIDTSEHIIDVLLDYKSTDSLLAPTIITEDSNATVSPASGTPLQFILGDTVVYTVTAHDTRIKQEWKVVVKEKEPEQGAEITGLDILTPDGTSVLSTDPNIDTKTNVVTATVFRATNLKELIPVFELSKKARIEPKSGAVTDFSGEEPVSYKVYPEDPELKPQEWSVIINRTTEDYSVEIESFSLSAQTKEPEILDDSISVEFEYGSQLDFLHPSLELFNATDSLGQTDTIMTNGYLDTVYYHFHITPFDINSEPFQIIVVAFSQDYLAEIENFSLQQHDVKINMDSANRTITADLPFETDFSNIIPVFEISAGATIYPVSGMAYSFTPGESKDFTVTAANGNSTSVWSVTLFREPESILNEKFELGIPDNWTVEIFGDSAKTWQAGNQDRNPFSVVESESSLSAYCPWNTEMQQEKLITHWIATDEYMSLEITFYAGFNTSWVDSANLLFSVVTQTDEDTLWDALSYSQTNEDTVKSNAWGWRYFSVNLNDYAGDSLRLSWTYSGKNGDLIGIDNIRLFGEKNNKDHHKDQKAIPKSEIQQDIVLFPNPTTGKVFLSHNIKGELSVLNNLGQFIQRQNIRGDSFTLGNLENGQYIIILKQKKDVIYKKIYLLK